MLGLIAGAGELPLEAAAELRAAGESIVAIGFHGITNPDLEREVPLMKSLALGQMAMLVRTLRQSNVERLLLLGKFSKSLLSSGDVEFSPDDLAIELLSTYPDRSDDGLQSLIAGWLETQGFELLSQSETLNAMLAPIGSITRDEPSESAQADFIVGWPVVQALGDSGSGQCVVVKEGVVLAVEAIEGTDETIRRAGRAGGTGATVIKALRSHQDRRFDLPAVGPSTIRVMAEVGATALAVEANAALILDRQRFVSAAEEAGISVWGFTAERESR